MTLRIPAAVAAALGLALLFASLACAASAEQDETAAPDAPDAPLPLAVQMFTLREFGSLNAQMALAASVGFEAIETIGNHGVSAEEMNDLLARHGLEVVSSHVQLEALREDLEGVVAHADAVGYDTVVMPWLDGDARPTDAAGWQALGAELEAIGERLREHGLRLAYHNHAFEMEVLDGQTALDHLFSGAAPESLAWQADVAWIDRGGQDPVELLARHADRIVSIHAKDNAPPGDDRDEGGFADVGYGVLDWEAILPAAREAGVGWYIVEHDAPADHQRTLRRSYEFLRERLGAARGRP